MPTRIRDFSDGSSFDKFVKDLLAAVYGDDFVVVNHATGTGDKGVDGYIRSQKTLLSAYCPESYDDKSQDRYQAKIREDLAKAKALKDSARYSIEKWIFVTPRDLDEGTNHFLMKEVRTQLGVEGVSWGDTRLDLMFQKETSIHLIHPDLRTPNVERQLATFLGELRPQEPQKKVPETPQAAVNVAVPKGQLVFIPEAACLNHSDRADRALQVRLILLGSASWTNGTEVRMTPEFTATLIPPGRGKYSFTSKQTFVTPKIPAGMHAYFLGKLPVHPDHSDIELCFSKAGVVFSGRIHVEGFGSVPIFPLCILASCGGGFVDEPIELRALKT